MSKAIWFFETDFLSGRQELVVDVPGKPRSRYPVPQGIKAGASMVAWRDATIAEAAVAASGRDAPRPLAQRLAFADLVGLKALAETLEPFLCAPLVRCKACLRRLAVALGLRPAREDQVQ